MGGDLRLCKGQGFKGREGWLGFLALVAKDWIPAGQLHDAANQRLGAGI